MPYGETVYQLPVLGSLIVQAVKSHDPVQRLLRLDAAHDVDDASVAGFDDADDVVVELDRVRATDDAVRDVTKLFDGDEWKLRIAEPLKEVLPARIHSDTVVSDEDVDVFTRGDTGHDAIDDGRDTATDQGCHDDGALASGCCIRVSARSAAEHAVGAGGDVHVEVGVDLERAEDDEVELVDEGPLIQRIRVLGGRNLVVLQVLADRLDGRLIEALSIDDRADVALVQEVDEWLRDAADGEAHLDLALGEERLEEAGRGEGGAATTGLEGKSVAEVRGRGHDAGTVFGHLQLTDVLGHADDVARDLRRVTDFVDDADIIDVDHRDGWREVRERHHGVGDRDDVVGVAGIDDAVGQHTAVALAADAAEVTILVRGRRTDKCDINVDVPFFDGAHAAAVASDDRRRREPAEGYVLADTVTDAGGLDADDGALFDHLCDATVRLAERRRADREVAEAHLLCGLEHHIDDVVTVAEMMMEGKDHAVPRAALLECLADAADHLASPRIDHAAHRRRRLRIWFVVPVTAAPEWLLPIALQNLVRDVPAHCI